MAQAGGDLPPRNTAGTIALLCSLLGLVFMALIPPIGLVLAFAAIVLGLIGRARSLRGEATNRGQALVSIALGGLGLVVSVVLIVDEAAYVAAHPGLVHSLTQCRAQARTSKAVASCVQRFTKAVQRG